MPDFLLPDLGEGLTDADIVSWLVAVGDEVTVDQPVVEVETAKAVVEVPIPFAGTVTAVYGRPGQSLAVGAPLISIGARPPATETPGSGQVLVGYGTSAVARRRHRATVIPSVTVPPALTGIADVRRVISPVVRALARDAGVHLAAVTGTGPDGIIRRQDVEREIRQATPPAVPETGSVRRIPLTGIRGLMAEKMSRSRREIPEATVWVDVDFTEMLAARTVINDQAPDSRISILALLARFALLGLRRFPELNGRIDGQHIVIPEHVQLGVAAHTDRGLVVPVIRDAEAMSARDLSAAISDRAAAARAGRLAPQQLSGGTFTINNYGIFGVDGSAAIINYPEVAILGLGRIIDRPWVVDGAVVARKVAQLSLVFDHRVCDGGVAGGYLRFVADCVEAPLGVLADI